MNRRGHAGRTDRNHLEIRDALVQAGCSVLSLGMVGGGAPDLMVGIRTVAGTPVNLAFEVKDGAAIPSKQKLTEDEEKWHAGWAGHVAVVRSVPEALEAVERYRRCRTV